MYIELEEHGPPNRVTLTPSEVNAIRAVSARWRKQLRIRVEPLVVTPVDGHEYDLAAYGVAGFVRASGLSIEIAPKFLNSRTAGTGWRSALWRLLVFGEGLENLGVSASGVVADDGGLADLLAEVFLGSVASAGVKGYPLGYRSHRELSEFMRGRLDQQRLELLAPFRGVLPVVTRRLTRDVPVNRLLKWASGELARIVESPNRRKRLLAWRAGLSEVSSVPPHIDRLVRPDRQHAHLAPAFDVSKLLLADRRHDFGDGGLDLPGFLWDSEDLFERVVRRLFDQAGRPLGFSATKRSHKLLSRTSNGQTTFTSTTPDVDVHWRGTSVLVVDAKYKGYYRDPSSDDVYQVMAAGRVTDVPVVALAYPSVGSTLQANAYVPVGNGMPTQLFTLELGLEAFATPGGVRLLQAEVSSWLAANTP